ncbi:hypothetical protein PENSPDRAFT_92677 [Peniophora sp. CONT]|nr:hypothetical protein PENSPDRAFT_92677 [Peniophora sp. CONT]
MKLIVLHLQRPDSQHTLAKCSQARYLRLPEHQRPPSRLFIAKLEARTRCFRRPSTKSMTERRVPLFAIIGSLYTSSRVPVLETHVTANFKYILLTRTWIRG